jgi:spermidine synthase
LRPGGVLAANTFSSSRLYDNESVTYRSVFGDFYNLKGNNRVILARNGTLPAVSVLQQQVDALDSGFRRLGFSMQDIMPRFSMSVDWNTRARILTDQYSPANLLNSR